MSFRVYLLSVCFILCLWSLPHANASNATNWPRKQVKVVNFSWENCGAAADPFQVRAFDLGPDPLKIPGDITAGLTFSFTTPSPTDIAIMVVMEKLISGFWFKVPCVDNIGSCNYLNICDGWSKICPAMFAPFGIPCTCPIPANTYTIPDITVEATQTLPSSAIGTFRVYINLLSGSVGELGCFGFQITMSN